MLNSVVQQQRHHGVANEEEEEEEEVERNVFDPNSEPAGQSIALPMQQQQQQEEEGITADSSAFGMQEQNASQFEMGGDLSPDDIREQDRFLPIANISRIMKKCLPQNAKISKEAKETVQECVSEFISFVTSESSDKCVQEKRKTINGEDVLFAMGTLGFDNYIDPLRIYLMRYRDYLKGDKSLRKPSSSGSTSKKPKDGNNFEE